MSKKRLSQPPGNESTPEMRVAYLTCNWTVGKDIVKEKFVARFGEDPETVFYGPPNGSLIYAGPVPEQGGSSGDN